MSTWLIVLVIFWVVGMAWVAYEVYTAPLMPDDFDLKEEDIWPIDERPCNEED